MARPASTTCRRSRADSAPRRAAAARRASAARSTSRISPSRWKNVGAGEPAHERPRQHRAARADHDERLQRVEQLLAHRVGAAAGARTRRRASARRVPRRPAPAPSRNASGSLVARAASSNSIGGSAAASDRLQRQRLVAEGVDVAVRREALDQPARDVPAEADRHAASRRCRCSRAARARGPARASTMRARRAATRCSSAARPIAQRARLRIREQAQQAIVLGDERRRVGDLAGRARPRARRDLRAACSRAEAQRARAQPATASRSRARRHRGRAARAAAAVRDARRDAPGLASALRARLGPRHDARHDRGRGPARLRECVFGPV